MLAWENAPRVTFARDGEVLELGRGPDDSVLHLHGSTGLGLAPVSIASSPRLTGDGNVVRGVRYEPREVFIPVYASADTPGELSQWRRDLTALLAPHLGPVDIRVEDPETDTDRMVRGLFKGGLEGDFGDDYRGSWQTLGLTFECSDPWWLGPEQVAEFRINPGTKPFLSASVPFFPVMLAQSVVQGRFLVDVRGAGAVWPVWEVVGPGEDLTISNGSEVIEVDGVFAPGSVTRIDAGEGTITPDRWGDLSLRSRLFQLAPGAQTLTVTLAGATTDTIVRLTYRERHLEGI